MQIFSNPVRRAIARANAEADVRRAKLAPIQDPGRIAQILGEEADHARMSPLAYDQILALALDAAADPEAPPSPVLHALQRSPSAIEQFQLRRHVFFAYDAERHRAVTRAAADWALRRASPEARADATRLAAHLREDARLNLRLWDHPALPVPPSFRALMLACVEPLRRRASAIARDTKRRRPRTTRAALFEGAPA